MASPLYPGASRGSAVEAAMGLSATGLLNAHGAPLPPSSNYLNVQEEAERHHKLDKAWRHYIGDIHGHMRVEPGQPDINVMSNRASTIVDTGVDFLYGKTVTFEVQLNGKSQDDAQTLLDQCWGNDARRMTLLSKLGQNGGIFGHVFAKIIPPNANRKFCRVVPLDPAQVSVVTDPDDCDTVLCYIIDYQQPDNRLKELTVGKRQIILRKDPDDASGDENNNDLYSYDEDVTWEISNWLRGPNNQWYQIGDPIEWPHQWAPVCDWQNLPLANMHWGMSDIPPNIQHLNSVLNLTLTDANALAKFHGFPWMYATAVNPESTIEVGPGKLLKFPSPDGKITAVQAYGDMVGLLNYGNDLRSDMDEQTRVPAVATGRIRDVPRVTSGVAFQMMYGPLLSKTIHKQRLYETGHEEISLRMLSLCGYGDGTGMDGWCVITHWPDPLPSDDQGTSQVALAASQIGMSKHYICELLGADYDTEIEYLKEEAQDKAKMVSAGLANLPVPPGLPSVADPSQMPPGQQASSTSSQPAGAGGPPVNHPAAVQQRQLMAATAKTAKVTKLNG